MTVQDASKTLQDASETPPRQAQDAPKAPPRRSKTLSRQPQDAPKTPPRRPKTPKMPQDAQLERDVRPVCPQDSLKTSQESLNIDFGSIFA